MKTVSVILASYNGEQYIEEQINSILAQTYPIHEILIGDDGSTDHTPQILNDYARKFKNIKIIHSEGKRYGVSHNFKRLMDIASGNCIAISDQDDIWFPEKIEVMMNGIGDCMLAYCNAIPFSGTIPDCEDNLIEDNSWNYENRIEKMMFNNIISGHRMLVKKEFVNAISVWNYDVYYDWWLAVSAAYCNSIAHIRQPLVLWRRHNNSLTLPKKGRRKKIFKVFKFLKRRYFYFQSLLKLFRTFGINNEEQFKAYKLTRMFASKSVCLNLYGCLYYCIKIKKEISYTNFIKPLKMWSK